jgi:transcription termination/antitermination protein NusG
MTTENEVTVEENELTLAKGDTADFKWYVAHVLSGFENRVSKTLKERILNHNMADMFSQILIPEEAVVANVNGKKRNLKKKFFPGYILIKMIMNDTTWHLVQNTDKITGFIGGTKGNPQPLSETEAAAMTNQMQDGFKRTKSSSSYSDR